MWGVVPHRRVGIHPGKKLHRQLVQIGLGADLFHTCDDTLLGHCTQNLYGGRLIIEQVSGRMPPATIGFFDAV